MTNANSADTRTTKTPASTSFLPDEANSELTASDESMERAQSVPKQVLVIDDDPTVRRMLSAVIEQAGFLADTAKDGEEGWEALCLTDYDLLITDHEMPRLTGLELIERLRAVSTEPPCLLISANLPGSEETLMRIVYPGGVLAKPFTATALITVVSTLLLNGGGQAL